MASSVNKVPLSRQLSQKRLKQLVKYNPFTGNFIRKVRMGNQHPGTIAGGIGSLGYVNIDLDHVRYKAHLLAFLYMKGVWPKNDPDHKNRIRSDNRWVNLRDATRSQNRANSTKRSDNTTGFVGVNISRSGKFVARIGFEGKRIQIGTFDTLDKAVEAYRQKAKEVFGEFYHDQ